MLLPWLVLALLPQFEQVPGRPIVLGLLLLDYLACLLFAHKCTIHAGRGWLLLYRGRDPWLQLLLVARMLPAAVVPLLAMLVE